MNYLTNKTILLLLIFTADITYAQNTHIDTNELGKGKETFSMDR